MADTKISALASATTPLAGTEVLPIVQSGATVKVAVSNLTAGRDISAATVTAVKNGVAQIYLQNTSGTTKNTQLIFEDNIGSKWRVGMDVATNNNSDSFQLYSDVGSAAYLTMSNAGNLTINTGNLIQGTAAKGIDFSANTPAAGKTSTLLNWYEEGTWTPTVTSSSGTITTVSGNVGRYTRVGRSITCVFNFTIADNGTGAGALFVTGLPFVGSQAVLTYYAAFGWNRTTGKSIAGEYNPGTGGTGRIALYQYDATYPVATGDTCECIVTYEV